MIGFMIISSFLSMWISNLATTAMMLPIAGAVLQQLKATEVQADEQDLDAASNGSRGFDLEVRQTKKDMTEEKQPDTDSQQEDGVCT